MRALAALLVLLAAAQPGTSADYRDPQGRFRFSYPAAWGTASPGTNDGFGGRLAAVRFSQFPAPLGGELVLTRGFPSIDLQAVGGLYDSVALEVFPDALRRQVLARLPRLTAATFCDALGRATHLDVSLRALPGFTAAQRLNERGHVLIGQGAMVAAREAGAGSHLAPAAAGGSGIRLSRDSGEVLGRGAAPLGIPSACATRSAPASSPAASRAPRRCGRTATAT